MIFFVKFFKMLWKCNNINEQIFFFLFIALSKKCLYFSTSWDLSSFYRASNAILKAVNKPSNEILHHIWYTNCIPVLTYACTVKEHTTKQMQEFGCCSLTVVFAITRKHFNESLPYHWNKVITLAKNLPIEPTDWFGLSCTFCLLLWFFSLSDFSYCSTPGNLRWD